MIRVLALVLICMASLTACGKKGSLEPPPGSTYPQPYPKE